MSSLCEIDRESGQATEISICDEYLTVTLVSGQTVNVPLDWYPRLAESTPEERGNWRLIDAGRGISWDDIDEDISVAGLMLGRRSGESEKSLARWRASRRQVRA